ncbi:MAG: hypothetical protein MN733_43190 [Nitrososphaera sp.]|nr:hypothetical protein [Nitrososphaera sp.]
MTALYTFNMLGVFEAEEPIIHTEESIGNIAKIKRMKVMHAGKPVLVPAISGNSFRGQMRDLIADAFVERVRGSADKVKMTPDVYSLIFSGGVMREGSDLSTRLESLLNAVPLLRVWGSAFGNVMMPSKIAVSHLIPLTAETLTSLNGRLEKLTGDHTLIRRLQDTLTQLPATDDITFEEGPLTRKDDLKNPLLLEDVDLTEPPAARGPQMIYHVECIASGTLLLHRIGSKFPLSQIELGCLVDGLVSFAKMPIIGGRSAAGYGRVNFVYRLSLQPSVGAAEEHWLDASALLDLTANGSGMLAEALKAYADDVANRADEIRTALAA